MSMNGVKHKQMSQKTVEKHFDVSSHAVFLKHEYWIKWLDKWVE